MMLNAVIGRSHPSSWCVPAGWRWGFDILIRPVEHPWCQRSAGYPAPWSTRGDGLVVRASWAPRVSSLSTTLPVGDKAASPCTGRWICSHCILTSYKHSCEQVFWQGRAQRRQLFRKYCKAFTFFSP